MQLGETALGVKLFDRDKHKFALTPSGQFLVERAREILNMVEKHARHSGTGTQPRWQHCYGRRRIPGHRGTRQAYRRFSKAVRCCKLCDFSQALLTFAR